MRDYKLFTDSTCDLLPKMYEDNGIERFIMTFSMDGKDYPDDGETLVGHEFYERMRNGSSPSTSQITPYEFVERFSKVIDEGFDVLYLCFASATSGTFASATAAREELTAKYPQAKVYVVDSCGQCGGEGRIALELAQRKAEGMGIDELYDYAEKCKHHSIYLFTVDDLNHLYRGGRLSKTSAVAGTMLNIKPVMYTAPSGKLTVGAKVRGRKKAIKMMAEKMALVVESPESQHMIINHADCPEDAELLEREVRSRVTPASIDILPMGPVIGAHVGPGCLALFFTGRTKEWV